MKQLLIPALAAMLAASVPASAEDTIKIGYIGGFTGWLAFYDGSHLDGVKLAIDEVNAAGGFGGKKLELLARDTRSEAETVPVLAQELLSAGVSFVIAPCDADPAIAVGQVFAATSTPVVTSCSTAPTTAELGGPNVFLSYPADNIQGAILAQVAVESGYKTALTVSSRDNVYTDKLPEYFAEAYQKMGGKIAGDVEFKVGQPDFSAEVTKIKAMSPQPDVIMTSSFEPDFPIFIKALRGAGVKTPVLEVDGIDSPTTYALGAVVDGVVFSNAGYPTPGSPLEKFNSAFEKATGKKSETVYNANGYGIIQTFKGAFEATKGDLTGASLVTAIDNLDNMPNVFGGITYRGQNRVPLADIAVNKIENGGKVFVKVIKPDPANIPKSK